MHARKAILVVLAIVVICAAFYDDDPSNDDFGVISGFYYGLLLPLFLLVIPFSRRRMSPSSVRVLPSWGFCPALEERGPPSCS